MLSAVFLIWMTLSEINLLEKIERGDFVSPSEADDHDNRMALAGSLNFAAFVFAIVTFCFWINRAYGNLSSIRPAGSLRFSPRWAVGWFFVPIMNLFRPYQVVNELYQVSNPAGVGSGLIGWWWGLWVIAALVGPSASSFFREQTVSDAILADWRSAIAEVLFVLCGVLALVIVHRITSWQDERELAQS